MKTKADKTEQFRENRGKGGFVSRQPKGQRRLVAETERPGLGFEDNRPAAIAQRKLQQISHDSPRQLAQAEQFSRLFGQPMQRQEAFQANEFSQELNGGESTLKFVDNPPETVSKDAEQFSRSESAFSSSDDRDQPTVQQKGVIQRGKAKQIGGADLSWDPYGNKKLVRWATASEHDQFVADNGSYKNIKHKGSTRNAVWFATEGTKSEYVPEFAKNRPWKVTVSVSITTESPLVNFEAPKPKWRGEAGHPDEVIVKNNEPGAYGIGRSLVDQLLPTWTEVVKKKKKKKK